MRGIVKKVVAEKGYGFIRDDAGSDFFFHRSSLRDIAFDVLKEGDPVEFEETDGQKGPRATDIRSARRAPSPF